MKMIKLCVYLSFLYMHSSWFSIKLTSSRFPLRLSFCFAYRDVEIADPQRKTKHLFLAKRWLSSEKEDGKVDCVLQVSNSVVEMLPFQGLFSLNAQKELEHHLWYCILYRAPRSTFTRCQRLLVAMTFLLCSMTSCIMYYKRRSSKGIAYENQGGLTFTPDKV